MKRIIAATVILLIVLGSSIGIYFKIISEVDRLTDIACEIRESVGQKEKTDFWETKRLSDAWDRSETLMVSFLTN